MHRQVDVGPGLREQGQPGCHSLRRAYGVEDRSTRGGPKRLDEVDLIRIEAREPLIAGDHGLSHRRRLGDDNPSGSHRPGDLGDAQPHRAAADTEDRRARREVGATHRVHGDAQEVAHRLFLEAHVIRHGVQQVCPGQAVVSVGARIEGPFSPPLGVSDVQRLPAEVLVAAAAEFADTASAKGLRAHPLAQERLVPGVIDLHYDPRELVPQRHIRGVVDVLAESMECPGILTRPITQVAPADTTSLDLDQDVLRRRQDGARHLNKL